MVLLLIFFSLIFVIYLSSLIVRELFQRNKVSSSNYRKFGIFLANSLTISRLFMVLCFFYLVLRPSTVYLFLILIPIFLTDIEDGRIARKMNAITSTGEKLDGFVDISALSLILLKLYQLKRIPFWTVFSICTPYFIIILSGVVLVLLAVVFKKLRSIPRFAGDNLSKITMNIIVYSVFLMILFPSFWKTAFAFVATGAALFTMFYWIRILYKTLFRKSKFGKVA